MLPGERFKNWIDSLADAWKDRLRGWMASWLAFGIEAFFEVLEKAAAPKFKPIIDRLEAESTIPPELKPLFDELKGPESAIGAVLANSAGGALIGGALGRIIDYILRPLTYGLSFSPGFYIHDAPVLVNLWRRGEIDESYLDQHLRWHGLGSDDIEQLKKVTEFIPFAPDLVNWQAKEVFEPEMIERYGLDSEFEGLRHEDFRKVGVTEEHERNYWRAHWEHASWMQVVEMLHRGELTEEEVYDWFRLVEIPPFWRDKLIKTAYTWPTRVDVRRWWDMRTIDETELRRLYSGMGYRGVNLDNYVLWTKVYVAFPDLMARWSKGWITIDEVRSQLTALGMPADRVEEMIQMKIKPEEPGRVEEGKALTKTEIYKGVKKEVITWDEGIELLMDLGYGYDEANYILTINVESLAGSPETFEAFKSITQKYKIATGREARPMTEEIKKAGEEVVRLTGEVKILRESIEAEKRGLVGEEVLPAAATRRLKGLQVKLHRAEAELARAKSEYDRLMAEWRHTSAQI